MPLGQANFAARFTLIYRSNVVGRSRQPQHGLDERCLRPCRHIRRRSDSSPWVSWPSAVRNLQVNVGTRPLAILALSSELLQDNLAACVLLRLRLRIHDLATLHSEDDGDLVWSMEHAVFAMLTLGGQVLRPDAAHLNVGNRIPSCYSRPSLPPRGW